MYQASPQFAPYSLNDFNASMIRSRHKLQAVFINSHRVNRYNQIRFSRVRSGLWTIS